VHSRGLRNSVAGQGPALCLSEPVAEIPMPRAIVAIGGGEIRTRGTAAIDGRLFDSPAKGIRSFFYSKRKFGFRTILETSPGILRRLLEMQDRRPVPDQGAAFERADSKPVLGGRHHLGRRRGIRGLSVDKFLKAACENGTVLSGVSAGSICWVDLGHSDSMCFYNPRKWKYINVRGLGLIQRIHCPHYDGRTRGVPRRKPSTAGFTGSFDRKDMRAHTR
jgi:dipeptidase E